MADAASFHAEQIERALWFGVKHQGSLNGQALFLMDGIINQGTNHGAQSTSQSTNTQWVDLVDHFQAVFQKNIKGKPNERIAFCGNTVLNVVSQIAQLDGTQNISPGAQSFGVDVMNIITPFGRVKLMSHPLFNENAIWTENMYTIHPGAIRMRWLRKTFRNDYDTAGNRISGQDAEQGVITSELSCELQAAQTMGIYTGIDTAAAAS
jgi:hypothetical protein